MIPVGVQDPNAPAESVRERRRRFGLDAPLPSDPRVVERAVLRHLSERRPDVVVLRMVRSPELPLPTSRGVSVAAGVAELLLLWPEGRSAFLAIRTQAQMPTSAERAFAELCRASAVPLRVVRSLPEARQALDDLGVPSKPENDHAVQESGVARRRAAGDGQARP